MNACRFAGRSFILSILLLLISDPVKADTTEIHYHIAGPEKVYLVWGINDWQKYDKAPAGTFIGGKLMRTPMQKNGDDYTIIIDIPAGNVIDYCFLSEKKTGPFGVKAQFWDLNEQKNSKYFHLQTTASTKAAHEGFLGKLIASGDIAEKSYSLLLLVLFSITALVFFFLQKYYYKKPAGLFSPTAAFVSLSMAFLLGMLFIRLIITSLLFKLLIAPIGTIPYVLSAAGSDCMYGAILIGVFGLLFILFKRARKTIFVIYAILVLLSLIASLVNIKVMEMLGYPFNYQWLYYSDFLKSTDASKAIGANITREYIVSCIYLSGAFAACWWLFYQLYKVKTWPLLLLLPLFIISSIVLSRTKKLPLVKTANPVLFFCATAASEKENGMFDKSYAGMSEFEKKNPDTVPPALAASFKKAGIKHVIFFVLESTPAEYVGPYSNIKATPFIDSLRHQAIVFENIYAHTPATNKSMFSFLCSDYPDLSFKSVTKELPDIKRPSITSELEQYGYRTAFFNSGDNQFQNAGGFLKSRGFDTLQDFRNNSCETGILSDSRFSESKLDGIADSCLPVKFFNWLGNDNTTPFFAMMWTFQTHYPYFPSAKTIDYGTGNPSLEKYLNSLRCADEALEQLVAGLRSRNLLDSTLIIVTGDHGEAFGRHNQTTHASNIFEENLHVPLLFINPVLFKDQRMALPGGITDIAPSIFSVLQKPWPASWQGENLFSTSRRKQVYFFTPYSDFLFGMRDDRYKFIFNATDNNYQLYDLTKDPHEENNIAATNAAYIKQADKKLRAWMYYQFDYWNKIVKNNQSSVK